MQAFATRRSKVASHACNKEAVPRRDRHNIQRYQTVPFNNSAIPMFDDIVTFILA